MHTVEKCPHVLVTFLAIYPFLENTNTMQALCLCILLFIGATSGSLLCYSCTNYTHPDECVIFKKCADSETCFVQSYLNETGHILYSQGCKEKQQCPGIVPPRVVGKRASDHHALCDLCCQEDFCNGDLCDHHYEHRNEGPRCLNCDSVSNIQDCRKIKRCAVHEICYAQSRPSGYKLGCVNRRDCHSNSDAGTVGVIIGRRQVHACKECCSGENCNSHLCTGAAAVYELGVDKVSENISVCEDNSYQTCQYMINILKAQCTDPNVMSLCPKSCGRCTDVESCRDNSTFNCAEVGRYFNICASDPDSAFKYCRRYCNLCKGPQHRQGPTTDCMDVLTEGHTNSGVYTIYPDKALFPAGIQAYCDMDTAGGGWTVIQRRMNGSVDFYKTWKEYKDGFGSPYGEYWIGNDALHALTSGRNRTLYIKLSRNQDGPYVYAEYSNMKVDTEANKYRLTFTQGSYQGNAGNHLNQNGPGDHNGMYFSTKDRDNDKGRTRSCAAVVVGGWWFNDCEYGCLNCKYLASDSSWGSLVYRSSWMMIK